MDEGETKTDNLKLDKEKLDNLREWVKTLFIWQGVLGAMLLRFGDRSKMENDVLMEIYIHINNAYEYNKEFLDKHEPLKSRRYKKYE